MKIEPMGAFSWLTLYTSSVCVCVFCQIFVANAEEWQQAINKLENGKSWQKCMFWTEPMLKQVCFECPANKAMESSAIFANCVLEDV